MTVLDVTPQLSVAQAAAANPNPVAGTSTALSALGSENGSGDTGLELLVVSDGPRIGVTYTGNTNGTTAASNITANFTASGNYNFTVTITDRGGQSTTSSVAVAVQMFAVQSGSTLDIYLGSAGPVTLTTSGANVTATQNGTQINFTGITSVLVTDTGSGDVLNFDGPLSTPFSFTNAGNSTVNVNSGTMIFAAVPGGSVTLGALTVASGASAILTAATTSQPTTLNLSNLSIGSAGSFDIANNVVYVNYGAGTDPISTIAGYLASGYNAGSWNGAGIFSSVAAANSVSYGLGYADSADPGNPASLPSGTIKIMYTLLGDADLNGVVNGVDFGIVAANFNKGVSRWDQGDFNFDGVVNGIDFGDLAANFNKGAGSSAVQSSGAIATSTLLTGNPAATEGPGT